jgi:hypothetical protein
MRPRTLVATEEEEDWFVKPGQQKKISHRAYMIIETDMPMIYKVMCCTHFENEYWNSWLVNEHGLHCAMGASPRGIRINFDLDITETRVRTILDCLHNFVEAYLTEAEEFKNGTNTIQKEAEA